MKLSEEELTQVLSGVSLQDIFSARKATPKEETELESIAEDVALEVEDTVEDLFEGMDI
jgi:hypothetical protein